MALGVSTSPALSAQDVTFSYHGTHSGMSEAEAPVQVLNHVTGSIDVGTVVGIVGPNGSGKSTFLKLLAGILPIQCGSVMLFGDALAQLPPRTIARHVAYVPQETQQTFPFTVGEMVLMGRFPHHSGMGSWRWEDEGDRRAASRAMEEMDVAHVGHRLIGEVSGGERQRAIVARALAQQTEILLLDEPTAFLDLHHQVEITRILRRQSRELHKTVVLVSHDLNMASQYCDELWLFHRGCVIRTGVPEEVLTAETIADVYECAVLVDRHPESGTPRISLPNV